MLQNAFLLCPRAALSEVSILENTLYTQQIINNIKHLHLFIYIYICKWVNEDPQGREPTP